MPLPILLETNAPIPLNVLASRRSLLKRLLCLFSPTFHHTEPFTHDLEIKIVRPYKEVVEVGALHSRIPERGPRHYVARKPQLFKEFRMWNLCESVNTPIVILMATLAYS